MFHYLFHSLKSQSLYRFINNLNEFVESYLDIFDNKNRLYIYFIKNNLSIFYKFSVTLNYDTNIAKSLARYRMSLNEETHTYTYTHTYSKEYFDLLSKEVFVLRMQKLISFTLCFELSSSFHHFERDSIRI